MDGVEEEILLGIRRLSKSEEPVTVTSVSKLTNRTYANFLGKVEKLVSKGLVVKKKNGRVCVLCLTESGVEAAKYLFLFKERINEETFSRRRLEVLR